MFYGASTKSIACVRGSTVEVRLWEDGWNLIVVWFILLLDIIIQALPYIGVAIGVAIVYIVGTKIGIGR